MYRACHLRSLSSTPPACRSPLLVSFRRFSLDVARFAGRPEIVWKMVRPQYIITMSSWCSPMPALVTYRIEAEGSPTTRQASTDNRNLPSCLMSPALHMSRESPHIPSNQIRVKVAEQTPRLIPSKRPSSTSEPPSKRTATKTADQEDASVLTPIRRLHAGILAEVFPQRIRWIDARASGLALRRSGDVTQVAGHCLSTGSKQGQACSM